MRGVRRAVLADVPQVASTLAAAFVDYPWTEWTVASDRREARLRGLYGLFARLALAHGELWVSDRCDAVAAWLPPFGRTEPAGAEGTPAGAEGEAAEDVLPEGAALRLDELAGDRAAAGRAAEAFVAARRPTEAHWYLASLGTRPDRRRLGLGGAVLAPVLARADAEGVGAATETSTVVNVGFYERHGFRVTDELVVPDGGPPVWLLWRPPPVRP